MTPKEILDFIKKVKTKSVEECAKADLHLCVDHRMDETDGEGKCFFCGKPIFFKDKFPEGGPQPKKVCVNCALEHARGEQSFDA